jgi:trk system potassium uptake protein TrkH
LLPKIWPAVLVLGWILVAVAIGEGVMALFALATGDGLADVFAGSAAMTAATGGGCVLTTKGRPFELRFRDATLLTVVSWFVVPAMAALPFLPEPVGLSVVDAYFEMVSGITTTGSTVMAGLDTAPPSILLWRSTIQWLGGIGIIGLAIVILPFLKIGGMQLFRLESSDRSEKAIPRVRGIALAVVRIYLVLTAACFLAYWMLGMTPFDALNHAFTTLCTGGYSTHDASFGYFDSPALEWAGVVFMVSGALPFLAYVRLLRAGTVRERVDLQAVAILVFLAAATAVLSLYLVAARDIALPVAFTKAAFNIVSIVTTTGYASTDYLLWGAFSAGFFFVLTFVGGCTGSTSGGLKIFRFQVIGRMIGQHAGRVVYPHAVMPIRYGVHVVSAEQVGSVGAFAFLYIAVFAVLSMALSATGLDAETSLSGVATALGNAGPGIGAIIGPAGNFSTLPDMAKLVLSVAMILGRLEILVVLVLFVPRFYR